MKLHAYLTKSRHGIFYFRWPQLQADRTAPRKSLRLSLRTRCPREAGRLARHLAVCGDELNRSTTGTGMKYAELRAMAHAYFQAQLDASIERRSAIGPLTAEERQDAERSLEIHELPNSDFWQLLGRENAEKELARFGAGTGIELGQQGSRIPVILDEIRKAKVSMIKAGLEYNQSLDHYVFTTPQSASLEAKARDTGGVRRKTPAAPQGGDVTGSGPLLSTLFAERRAEAEKGGEWSPKLLDDYQRWTSLFIELFGDRPLLEYRKPDARAFKEALSQLPANSTKYAQTKELSTREAIEAAKTHNMATLSTSTINKALGRMQALWNWADKQLDAPVSDIFGPMKLATRGSARTEASPFSKDQLQVIFSSPLFTGCKSERLRTQPGLTDMSGTSWYWLPLLGLFTGARLNELCQLRIEDVDEDGGIQRLRFRQGDETQRIKGGKAREVPLHPELLRLGFLKYVRAKRSEGHERVFPNLTIDRSGYYSDRSSKDFSSYITKLGIKSDKTSFHSFRHNFKDACRHAGVPPDINDILLGHALPGMAGRYGDGSAPLELLYDAVARVQHAGLSLQHLRGYTQVR